MSDTQKAAPAQPRYVAWTWSERFGWRVLGTGASHEQVRRHYPHARCITRHGAPAPEGRPDA